MSTLETVTVKGPTLEQSFEVWGETTCIKGVVITPNRMVKGDKQWWTGYWSLTHVPTGQAVNPYPYLRVDRLRALARKLAVLCDDWSGLGALTAEWPDDLKPRVREVLLSHYDEVSDDEGEWT